MKKPHICVVFFNSLQNISFMLLRIWLGTKRDNIGTVKLHVVLNYESYRPLFGQIVDGSIGEIKMGPNMNVPWQAWSLQTRGYIDYR